VKDPQRLLRLPGFVNRKHKYHQAPPTAQLVVCEPARRYSWKDLQPKHAPEPLQPRDFTPEELAAMPPVAPGSLSRV